jgi:tetratricopeptide (TPR) repeat protein
MDQDGFIYTTTSEVNSNDPIKKLNSTGIDVLRRKGYFPPRGDLSQNGFSEGSMLIDVTVRDNGVYSVLDSKRGRIFTYNEDGNLMYIFGQLGMQEGTFMNPAAIESTGDNLLVLDRAMNRVTIFSPTRYGALMNESNALYSLGKHDEAVAKWEQILMIDANNETAYDGIGKALLRRGDYKRAMDYLKLGYDREYYSKAFAKYRKDTIRGYFGTIMTGLIIIVAAYFVGKRLRKRLRGGLKANVS